jgi:hypothetical protein
VNPFDTRFFSIQLDDLSSDGKDHALTDVGHPICGAL